MQLTPDRLLKEAFLPHFSPQCSQLSPFKGHHLHLQPFPTWRRKYSWWNFKTLLFEIVLQREGRLSCQEGWELWLQGIWGITINNNLFISCHGFKSSHKSFFWVTLQAYILCSIKSQRLKNNWDRGLTTVSPGWLDDYSAGLSMCRGYLSGIKN